MSDFVQNLRKGRDDLQKSIGDYSSLEAEIEIKRARLSELVKIDRTKISEANLCELIHLERELTGANNELERQKTENIDRRNRIAEIDAMLQSQDHLDEVTARMDELESELQDLERTAAQFDGGIDQLKAIKADAQQRMDGLTSQGSEFLLASVGLGAADTQAPKQSEIARVQHEIQAVTAALQAARATRQEHDDHIKVVQRDKQNQQILIGQAKCDVARMEHAQALEQYMPFLAKWRMTERQIGQWSMQIDHEAMASAILRESGF